MNPNETMQAPDGTGLDRREFLRLSGALAAAGALASAGCQVPQEATIPFHDMPETLVDGMGRARFFHTVIDGSPVLVRTREGRPILVAPSPTDTSGRGLSVRHHAALMDLYDPDRARGPVSVRRGTGAPVASNWPAVTADVLAKLRAAGDTAVLLTAPVQSPALAAVIAALTARTGLRHVVWSPLESDAAGLAWQRAFGDATVAKPRIDKADVLLGLGAEFLDRPDDGLERDFAVRRSPDQPEGARMSRFVQLEGRLTLTGANADVRVRVRDSQLPSIAAALAHELVVTRNLGPLAGERSRRHRTRAVHHRGGREGDRPRRRGPEGARGRTRGGLGQGAGHRRRLGRRIRHGAGARGGGPRPERHAGGVRRRPLRRRCRRAARVRERSRPGRARRRHARGPRAAPGRRRREPRLRRAGLPADRRRARQGAVHRLDERSTGRDDARRRRAGAGQPSVRVLGGRGAAEGPRRGPAAGGPAALRHPRPARGSGGLWPPRPGIPPPLPRSPRRRRPCRCPPPVPRRRRR